MEVLWYNRHRLHTSLLCYLVLFTVPLGENVYNHIHFLDGRQSMGNFDTLNLHRLSQLGKSYMFKKTTVNLFQTSNISKFYIKTSYRSAGSIEIKTCPIKVISRSEFKFLSISFLGHPGCLVHLVLYWLWKALQGFQKNK